MKKDQTDYKLSDLNNHKLIIALDGYSSCGKSTLAKDLAKELDYIFIDSGAMYRAVSLLFIQKGIAIEKDKDYSNFLATEANIHFEVIKNNNITFLNDVNVESQIRSPEVAAIVSQIAENSSVRKYLVNLQRKMGNEGNKGVVMDGRDIGTVVFPNADFKLFITADADIRAKRRYQELKDKGAHVTLNEVKQNLESRDLIDSTRKDSPLRQAHDAIPLDTTHHTRKSQLKVALEYIMSNLKDF